MNREILHVLDPYEYIGSVTIKALELPIRIDVNIIYETGDGIITFSTKEKDEYKFICETYLNIFGNKPEGLKELVVSNGTERYIATQISEWIVTYIREGKFYLDDKRMEYINAFELERVAEKASKILDTFYQQWNKKQ